MPGEFQSLAGRSTVSKGKVLGEEIGGIIEQGYVGPLVRTLAFTPCEMGSHCMILKTGVRPLDLFL